jgi:molybdate transport system permease protein
VTAELLSAAAVTVALATITTLLLMAFAPAIAWWLSRSHARARAIVEALVALPLVLPPTVIGFYLLIAMAPTGFLGSPWLALTGRPLAFSFAGLVVGSVIYSLPFAVQPLTAAFRGMDLGLLDAATVLGASPRTRFFRLVLPLNRRALIAAAALCFAHTIGEFGIVLMIGGNIPGQTRVLSIALFDQVESLHYGEAHITAALLLVAAMLLLTFIYMAQRPRRDAA